jgi:hypothetical protein
MKSGVEPPPPPIPVSATICGLDASLSMMLIIADSEPDTVGVNTTLYVQDDPAARVAPQVVEGCEKSIELGPEKVGPVMAIAELERFSSVTILGVLAMLRG